MDRREFLRTTTAATVAIAAGVPLGACAVSIDRDALDEPELLAMLGPESVRSLGLIYRQSVPAEADEAALSSAIIRSGRWRRPSGTVSRESLAQQIREEFAAGRTVLVDGWILAATEARQCALFSLRPR